MKTIKHLIMSFLLGCLLWQGPAWGAISFVTSASNSTNWDASDTTPEATGTWSLGAGNLVVVCVAWNVNVTISSVTDTAGNTYTDSGLGRQTGGLNYNQLFYAYNTTAHASNAVSVAWSGNPQYTVVEALEYSGVKTSSSPLDQTNFTAASIATGVTSGSFTPSEANEVAVACTSRSGGGTVQTSPDSNYVERIDRVVGGSIYAHQVQDRIGAPASSQTSSVSVATGTDYFGMIVATFKAASRRVVGVIQFQ